MAEKRWLTCLETSQRLGLHEKTIRALIRARAIPFTKIPSIRPGGRGMVRVDGLGLDRLLEEREVQPLTGLVPIDRRRR